MSAPRLTDFVKAYDVRGLVPEQLSPQVARVIGAAFAQVIATPEGASAIVIGHDMRPSSPELARAFAEGAVAHGVDVTLIGLCSTDGLYYASGALDVPGAMFTASHNPARYNGIKLCRAGARPVGQESGLAEVRDLAQWLLDRGDLHPSIAPGRVGSITERDLLADYAAHLRGLVDLSAARPLKVVVDAGNGMAGHTVPAVLGTDGGMPGLPLEVVPLYFELDGNFPNHEANPLEPENLRDLQAAVLEHGADLGLAFDGDADRCFVVDETGAPVPPSAVTALVAEREVARAVADGTAAADIAVVHNLISSRAVPEIIAATGARPVRTRVGHSYIKQEMASENAVFGGEHSAHYYFRDFWFADTGMLAAMHVLAALGEQQRPLSQLVASYTRYVASGEINSPVADVPAATARVRDWATGQGGVTEDDLDGLTLTHEGEPLWWLNLRASNTEPLLRLNVEAADRATMERVRDAALAAIRTEGERP
ncbi:phosphomannomutase/phosphoglucomutase [Calidifontibacter sp. DB0510]|uniref:Phosphomannomutase/phosphoglucomutase n=1 Tax=Metallococcus carri TaxID=1656884 RepID=A0A967EDB9_9MICO|nr:phosphomannomutase/phosphoglucomutase [Metallococcus carri]NHN54571.1 phosphomannomutase/phosphoglucomutase [Metallococcus carri]NOP36590.1 phosphomannomutase/phosphoglucomutase [Calidifontibacter sp. DB2511S]